MWPWKATHIFDLFLLFFICVGGGREKQNEIGEVVSPHIPKGGEMIHTIRMLQIIRIFRMFSNDSTAFANDFERTYSADSCSSSDLKRASSFFERTGRAERAPAAISNDFERRYNVFI